MTESTRLQDLFRSAKLLRAGSPASTLAFSASRNLFRYLIVSPSPWSFPWIYFVHLPVACGNKGSGMRFGRSTALGGGWIRHGWNSSGRISFAISGAAQRGFLPFWVSQQSSVPPIVPTVGEAIPRDFHVDFLEFRRLIEEFPRESSDPRLGRRGHRHLVSSTMLDKLGHIDLPLRKCNGRIQKGRQNDRRCPSGRGRPPSEN
jgi:hypothetical protein